MKRARFYLSAFAGLLLSSGLSFAGVWTDIGDAQVRSDIELAVATRALDNITTQGPMPWSGIMGQLQNDSQLTEQPEFVRAAAARLVKQGGADLDLHHPHLSVTVDATNAPATVRGYDALGYAKGQAQVVYDYMATSTAVHLAVGAQTKSGSDKQALVLDGSYIAQRIDGIVVYGGWLKHWWGPGWISGMNLSTNARPMPQVGITRVHSQPFETWWLNWLGPWQFEALVGVLNGPREDKNTGYVAMHFAFNPLPGLEIGMSRTTEICGSHHPCQPLAEYFTVSNDPKHINQTNDEATIELRYSDTALSYPYAVYAQFMNEDTSPITNSGTSRLYGASVWIPFRGLTGRLTLEYANSIATNDIFWGGANHGFAYNNWSYKDGMRYRGRTLGFSLDSDSALYSVQASVVDPDNWTYSLTYHRALVSNPQNTWGNVVSPVPVRFHAVEARTAIPLKWGEYNAKIDLAARWQDDRPRPDHGGQLAVELALRFGV